MKPVKNRVAGKFVKRKKKKMTEEKKKKNLGKGLEVNYAPWTN